MPLIANPERDIRRRFPRYIAAGMDYNDLERALASTDSKEDWRAALEQLAGERKQMGLDALEAGHSVTAAESLVSGAVYYHFAQVAYFEDYSQKLAMGRQSREAHRLAYGLLRPPIQQLRIGFRGIELVANLRVPDPQRLSPIIILIPGVDSTKEELTCLEPVFLSRGMATLALDGPGQGETWEAMRMIDDYEACLTPVVDALEKVTGVDAGRVGVYGRSHGGFLAPRCLVAEARIRAAVSAGGYYDLSNWDQLTNKQNFRHAWGYETLSEAKERAKGLTLSGLMERVRSPLLIVHSGHDSTFSAESAQRMATEAGGEVLLKIYPEGTHVCDNIPYKYRPFVADWLAEKLR